MIVYSVLITKGLIMHHIQDRLTGSVHPSSNRGVRTMDSITGDESRVVEHTMIQSSTGK